VATDTNEYYQAYVDYSRTLRTWLVAYGVGGPALMLTNTRVGEALSQSGHARLVAALFLVGVVVQITLAAVNKTAMWICYFSDGDEETNEEWWCRAAAWLSTQYWIDLVCDLVSLTAFAVATWVAFNVLVVA
jgi:hypothetical protein